MDLPIAEVSKHAVAGEVDPAWAFFDAVPVVGAAAPNLLPLGPC